MTEETCDNMPKTRLDAARRHYGYDVRFLEEATGLSGSYIRQVLSRLRPIPDQLVGPETEMPVPLRLAAMEDRLAETREQRDQLLASERVLQAHIDHLRMQLFAQRIGAAA